MRGSARRVLLKLSGEAFQGPEGAISSSALARVVSEIAPLKDAEIAVVVGGGNIIRGGRTDAFERIEGDTLGMLATVLNALALRSILERTGRDVVIQSAVDTELADPISPRKARDALSEGAIVLFAGGTGSPLVTTDTAAAIRAVSIGADLLAKASNVDGVYDRDPAVHADSTLLQDLSFEEVLKKDYKVMDRIAVEICAEHGVPIEVFNFDRPGALRDIASGKRVGSRIE